MLFPLKGRKKIKQKYSFEDKISVINREIMKRRGKWMLSSLSYLDYDDISQILRIHIFKKWDMWNQDLPLENWLNRVVTHKIINLVRDHYGRVAPPCNGCPHNLADDSCSFTKTGSRGPQCPLYKKWQKKTQAGYNIKLASSMNSDEFVEPAFSSISFGDNIDYESSSEKLHKEMKKVLSKSQYRIYELLIMDNLSDKEVAKRLKLKSTERGRLPGYKHLTDMRNKFYEMAKKIIEEKDIL